MAELMVARLRLPIFSIKHPEAFQVRSSLPVPQPSSLVGLLAYCLGVARGWGTVALERVREWVREGKLLAARASLARDQPPLAASPIVLRRFRIADEAYARKEKREPLLAAIKQRDFKAAKIWLEVKLTDALYREYIMGYELLCAWALDEALDVDPGCLYLAQRLGDTESLCTVVEVRAEEAEVGEEEALRTVFPTPMEKLAEPVRGSYTVARMCDEERQLRPYVLPCELAMEKVEGGFITLVRPSEVEVRYEEPVRVIRSESGLALTAFWPRAGRRRRRGRGRA